MKLIIKQYLSSLREREELDAILPDLVSQLGLNVFSTPRRGTLQHGVDVAAVGCLEGKENSVYLFSIKSGDLTHNEWNGDNKQALRPSLDEIIDSYIPGRLPQKYRDLPIKICLCFGGDIREPVRPSVTGYINRNTQGNIQFEEWNGDKLSEYILNGFLNENLMPEKLRFYLRKSLAFIDDPEISYSNFSKLVRFIVGEMAYDDSTKIRLLSICLWMLYAWCREQGNIESAFKAAEESLLLSWDIARKHMSKKKIDKAIISTFNNIHENYISINKEYVSRLEVISSAKYAISSGIYPQSSTSINIKLFDVVSRLSMYGLWMVWVIRNNTKNGGYEKYLHEYRRVNRVLKEVIENNPASWLPIQDDQGIDISIALYFLSLDSDNSEFIKFWLFNIIKRSIHAFEYRTNYPCIISDYSQLLEHPEKNDEDYFKRVTSASVLYVIMGVFSCLHGFNNIFEGIQLIKNDFLKHTNFQVWYVNPSTEEHIYINDERHGSTLSKVDIGKDIRTFLKNIFSECEKGKGFNELSSVKYGYGPLIVLACRRYRYPLPLDFIKDEFKEEIDVLLK